MSVSDLDRAHQLAYQNSNELLHVISGHPETLRARLKGEEGRTVPHILAFMGYDALYRKVVQKYPECLEGNLDRMGSHVLHYLVDRPATLAWQLKQDSTTRIGGGINTVNKKGLTPLAYAIVTANYDAYRLLLRAKADPNRMPVTSEPTLVVKYVSHQTMKWLNKGKRYGMNLLRVGLDARHILEECLQQGKRELFQELVRRRMADINFGGPLRTYPVFDIIKHGDDELLRFGVDQGMITDGSIRDASWSTPAHRYFRAGAVKKETALHLLEGTGGDSIDGFGNTLLEVIPEPLLQDNDVRRLVHRATRSTTGQKKKSTQVVKIPSASSSHPVIETSTMYSASIDHVVFFLLSLLDRHPSTLHLPSSPSPIPPPALATGEHPLHLRMKMRLGAIRQLSSHLDMFIEYASPDLAVLPQQLPASFPPDKISVYLLSLVSPMGNHSNIVLVDTRHKVIERFDPEGRPETELDDWLRNKVFHQYTGEFQYRPVDGRSILQLVETSMGDNRPGDPIGYCTAWCIWYIECRAANPNVHPDNLLDVVSEKLMRKGIRKHIRQYSLSIAHRRNQFIKSVLGTDSDAVNREQFSRREASELRRYVDAWLKMI